MLSAFKKKPSWNDKKNRNADSNWNSWAKFETSRNHSRADMPSLVKQFLRTTQASSEFRFNWKCYCIAVVKLCIGNGWGLDLTRICGEISDLDWLRFAHSSCYCLLLRVGIAWQVPQSLPDALCPQSSISQLGPDSRFPGVAISGGVGRIQTGRGCVLMPVAWCLPPERHVVLRDTAATTPTLQGE